MNLEDYAYNEGDRWYIDPRVSLAEQNAFIDNYRNIEAANSAQAEAQTNALGTQVPSQLGGLTGGRSYFASRYQTPQANQAVAGLRAVAQAAALEASLQNEVNKYKKLYRDAQNAGTGGGTNGLNALDIETVDNGDGGKVYDTEYVGEEEVILSSSGKDISKTTQKGDDESDEEYLRRITNLYTNGDISEEDYKTAYHSWMAAHTPGRF